MTKLLYIPYGQYITFVSSFQYDRLHKSDPSVRVITWEDSYAYCSLSKIMEEYISKLLKGHESIIGQYGDEINFCTVRNEFEIIYD